MEATIQNTGNVQQLLKYTYGLVPIVAGLDKFSNILTDWKDTLLRQSVTCCRSVHQRLCRLLASLK